MPLSLQATPKIANRLLKAGAHFKSMYSFKSIQGTLQLLDTLVPDADIAAMIADQSIASRFRIFTSRPQSGRRRYIISLGNFT